VDKINRAPTIDSKAAFVITLHFQHHLKEFLDQILVSTMYSTVNLHLHLLFIFIFLVFILLGLVEGERGCCYGPSFFVFVDELPPTIVNRIHSGLGRLE